MQRVDELTFALARRTLAPMAVVSFERAAFEVEVRPGSRVIDVTDAHPEAEVPYSCRAASCGTCRVKVLQGAEALAPAGDDEKDLLEILGAPPDVRLCCQLIVTREAGRISLQVLEE